jgi:hypothetical protein
MFAPLEIMRRCSAAGLDLRIIPAGFNGTAGISNGVCPIKKQWLCQLFKKIKKILSGSNNSEK